MNAQKISRQKHEYSKNILCKNMNTQKISLQKHEFSKNILTKT